MQFTLPTTLLTLLSASTALAAPTAESVSAMAAVPEWTIESMKRTCNAADTQCDWSFSVDTHLAAATPCTFSVTGSPASQTDLKSGATCGPYTVTTGWSGVFGPGNGFTTLAVVDYGKKLITWPSYTDKELGTSGVVVNPNKSYAPATL